MKADNYLTLCVEQAAKSPLHYRHGAIVVRGGKVIGQGYNCYRPGFDGGSLKSGRIANTHLDGDAIAALKAKLKKTKDKDHSQSQQDGGGNFIPFEGMSRGGGPNVNTPLSMHSEMMAIHSALAASSTLSSTAFSREKPCFKLPREDKRKSRLRRDVLLAYAAAICEAAPGSGKWQVKLENRNCNNGKREDKEDAALQEELDGAFQAGVRGAKHHWKKSWKGKHQKESQYEYEGTYGQYGVHGRHQHQQPAPSASKARLTGNASRGNDATTIRSYNDVDDDEVTIDTGRRADDINRSSPRPFKKHGNYYNQPGMRSHAMSKPPSPEQHFLTPVGRAGEQRHSVAQRKKNPRLQGADLYVTRVGWPGKPNCQPRKSTGTAASQRTNRDSAADPTSSTPSDEDRSDSLADSISTLSITSIDSTSPTRPSPSTPASLHDELINPFPSSPPTPPPPTSANPSFTTSQIHASRPCYRCISFMHAVGIRRVFWTNDKGEWEGGKVAALVEGMEGGFEESGKGNKGGEQGGGGGGGGVLGNGVFVTKHEVLMLRRMMGARSEGGGGVPGDKRSGGGKKRGK